MFNKSLIIIAILLMANNIYGQRRLVDKVIAVVGEEPLYLSELNANLAYAEAKGDLLDEYSQCLFFENLLTDKLLVNQAEIDSVVVTDGEVNQQVNGRISQILTAMNNDTSRFTSYYGKTVESVKEEMYDQMEDQLIRQRMQRSILGRVNVTPSEVKEFFENNKDSLPYYNAEVEVAEVVMLPEANVMQKQLSYDLLSELRQKIIDGETSFESAAKEFSHDPGSAIQGGDLGLVARGTFVPEFEGAAFNLDINEYSEIIETDFGYHFMQLLD